MTGSSFFQRLKFLTGNALAFDLPTEVMFEIAHRAGVTTAYCWGDNTLRAGNFVCYDNSRLDDTPRSVHVGSKTSNKWGLFDMSGNLWEWCRDDSGLGNLADSPDPFTPYYNNAASNAQMHGGGVYNSWSNNAVADARASFRTYYSKSTAQNVRGFRVSVIMQ
jgi:formylglycine-generating enzyme required for sulfatase activity